MNTSREPDVVTDGIRIWRNEGADTRAVLAQLQARMLRGLPPEGVSLQEGRNRLVRVRLGSGNPPVEAVVKCFGRQTPVKDLFDRQNGTKALRSYRTALHLCNHGIGTPQPLACLEQWRGRRLLTAWLVTRYEPGLISLKAALVARFRGATDCGSLLELLEQVAHAVRSLHDANVRHRDLGNQNLLLKATPGNMHRVFFTDLNRARIGRPLSPQERGRDLARLYLPSDLLRVFLEMYWGDGPPPRTFLNAQRRERKRYAIHAATRSLRHPLREHRRKPDPDGEYPGEPDLWIWDQRSVQAISALTSRDRHRYYPLDRMPTILGAVMRHGPALRRAWKRLSKASFQCPRSGLVDGVAVAVTGELETLDTELALLGELGVRHVLLRFYHHAGDARRREALEVFDRLHASGLRVSVALVQDRRAVRYPDEWTGFCHSVLQHVHDRAAWVEYGHAINRVKWGIWGFSEYRRFCKPLSELRAAYPDVDLTGPAVIDFEFEFALAALDQLPPAFHWDALTLHLYVDRRGAPENPQGRFDARDKFVLARAMAQATNRSEERVMVSEFNWPLSGTGVWSPVGSPYASPGERQNDPSVDETDDARFIVRYLLLALCSGHVETCVLWRLVAHGFGLVDDPAHGWRRRPAFLALRVLLTQLKGAQFMRALTACRAPGPFVLQFEQSGARPLIIAWAHPNPVTWNCEFDPVRVLDLLGREQPTSRTVTLGPDPLYVQG